MGISELGSTKLARRNFFGFVLGVVGFGKMGVGVSGVFVVRKRKILGGLGFVGWILESVCNVLLNGMWIFVRYIYT